MDWKIVHTQLTLFRDGFCNFEDLSDLTIDTLYGSMWGLNHRYMSLEEALLKDKDAIMSYSIYRINLLIGKKEYIPEINDICISGIGYGTYGWKYNPLIIKAAIHYGAYLIDTAEGYGYGKVETELGLILKNSKDIPIYTKVRRDHMSPKAIMSSVDRSIQKLNAKPYVLLHFPNNKYQRAIYDLMYMYNKGLIKGIGLSNCSVDMIEYAKRVFYKNYIDPPFIVQMPFNISDSRIDKVFLPYCQSRNIPVMAYSPLGQNFKKFNTPFLTNFAKRYDASSTQIALAWILSHKGVIPIPTTNNIDHLKQNMESINLTLDINEVIELQNYYKSWK